MGEEAPLGGPSGCRSSVKDYDMKQVDSMLCICVVIDHIRCQNVVKTSVTHSVNASCTTF